MRKGIGRIQQNGSDATRTGCEPGISICDGRSVTESKKSCGLSPQLPGNANAARTLHLSLHVARAFLAKSLRTKSTTEGDTSPLTWGRCQTEVISEDPRRSMVQGLSPCVQSCDYGFRIPTRRWGSRVNPRFRCAAFLRHTTPCEDSKRAG
jgi:hypothetical protein